MMYGYMPRGRGKVQTLNAPSVKLPAGVVIGRDSPETNYRLKHSDYKAIGGTFYFPDGSTGTYKDFGFDMPWKRIIPERKGDWQNRSFRLY